MRCGSGDLHTIASRGWAAMPTSPITAVIAEAKSSTDPRRIAVIEEALGWLRTPYHHMARVKGVGVDCLTLLAEVYERARVIPHVKVPFYPPDWNLHRDAERYLDGVMQYAREIPAVDEADPPQPADIAVFKFGRCFAHGAIVLHWPRLIHAWHSAGVVYADATQGQLAGRLGRFFDPFSATR
jgi:cell wall-associated NlpC family hydrolase